MRRILGCLMSFSLSAGCVHAQTVSDPSLEVRSHLSGFSGPIAIRFLDLDRAFVIQKDDGKVILDNRGVRTTVLDLNVQHDSERGLIGITLDPAFAVNGYVYLFHSVTSASTDSTTSGEWVANRVTRYTWNGTALINPLALGDFGVTSTTLPNGPNHSGGVVLFGPDGRLYGTTGDLNRQGTEQNAQGAQSAGVGGIFRIGADGSTPADNPFVSNAPYAKWYAYGVRNSFGLAFDPINGNLWDTENGPADYDEINLVAKGFNSGWNKIMGPDSRDPQNAPGDLAVLSGSAYSDPEFSWQTTIGVTSIQFLAATLFGPRYLDAMLTSDVNTGQLYRLRLNAARTGFVLTGALADLVADNSAEATPLVLGQGFGAVSDMIRGPDGAIYVTSLSNGTIYRVAQRPANDYLVDFGGSIGLWLRRNDSAWVQVHSVVAGPMAAGDVDNNGRSDVLIDLGGSNGLWTWKNGSTWAKVHNSAATQIVASDLDNNGQADFVINFGSAVGLWAYLNDGTWKGLHSVAPRQVASGNLDSDARRDLVVDFGAQYGIWQYMNNGNWVSLHGTSAQDIVTGDLDGNGIDEVVIDFGPQYGLWVRMNQASWVQLHGVSPQRMVVGNIDADPRKDLVVDFGSQYGIWVWKNNSSWQGVHAIASEALEMADLDRNGVDDLIVDFGSQYGLWAWKNGATWVQQHGSSPRKFISLDTDGQ